MSEIDRGADRVIGAQGAALIAELLRLQKALDLERRQKPEPIMGRLEHFRHEQHFTDRRNDRRQWTKRTVNGVVSVDKLCTAVSVIGTRLWSGCTFLLGHTANMHGQPRAGLEVATGLMRAFEGQLRTGLLVIVATIGIFGGCATLIPLSGAVIIPGTLVVESSIKKIQHPAGGVVAKILVRDGMRVQAGDLVLQLDETQVKANYQVLLQQLKQIRAREARLIAERDEQAEPEFSQDMAGGEDEATRKLWASEMSLFKSRAVAHQSAKELLHDRIEQLKEQISGLEAQVKSKIEQRDLIAHELDGVEKLYRQGLVPLTRKTALEREAARLEGDRGQAWAAIAEAKSKMGETELQIVRLDQDFRTEVMKDLREVQDKEAELVQKSVAARDLLKRVDLHAPASGVIHQLVAHTVGGVVAPGEVVMEIVPDLDELQIEAKLPSRNIDQVHPTQTAYVRFSAFNQRTTPQLEGKIAYVSPDLAHDQQTNTAYYSVRVTLPENERHRLGNLQLVSGMPAEVFLQTGTRTIISYLFKPISDQLTRTFREP
jgi:HlyD family secretion protein